MKLWWLGLDKSHVLTSSKLNWFSLEQIEIEFLMLNFMLINLKIQQIKAQPYRLQFYQVLLTIEWFDFKRFQKLLGNMKNWKKEYDQTKMYIQLIAHTRKWVCMPTGKMVSHTDKILILQSKSKNYMVIGKIFWVATWGLISHEAIWSASSGRMKGNEISRIIRSPQNGHSLAIASSSCDRSCPTNSCICVSM